MLFDRQKCKLKKFASIISGRIKLAQNKVSRANLMLEKKIYDFYQKITIAQNIVNITD